MYKKQKIENKSTEKEINMSKNLIEVKLYKINICGAYGDIAHGGYDINEIYIPDYNITLNFENEVVNIFKCDRMEGAKAIKSIKMEKNLAERINEIATLNEKINTYKRNIIDEIKNCLIK